MTQWLNKIMNDRLPKETERYNVVRHDLPTEAEVNRWKQWAERISCPKQDGHTK